MSKNTLRKPSLFSFSRATAFFCSMLLLAATPLAQAAITLTVVDENGALVDGYRWLLEEDQTFDVEPGLPTQNSLALDFHNSYSPVLASGECTGTGIYGRYLPAMPGSGD